MSLFQNANISNGQTHIYYDAVCKNTGEAPVQLIFQEKRLTKFITNPSDWWLTCVRYTISTIEIPLMIPAVLVDGINTDPNKLEYSLTMSFIVSNVVYTFQQYLEFIPENMLATAPVAPFNIYTTENAYYYLNSFNAFVNMLNIALVNCWNGLKLLVVAAGGTMPNTAPNILFQLDPTTGLMQLDADILQYDKASLVNPVKVFMNSQLHTLLNGFPSFLFGYNVAKGANVQFVISNSSGTNKMTIGTVVYVVMFAEFSTCGIWTPLDSLVITSNIFPVTSSLQTPTISPGMTSSAALGGLNSNAESRIVTDMQVLTDIGTEYRQGGGVMYNAVVYRLIDMLGNDPLDTLEITFFWKNKQTGRLIPLFLDTGAISTVKLLFRSKKLGV